ncbi:hypothetical protein PG994_003214 [Apiospora phragmitis]|uniref:Uncharacterized protein n=1 Tax=Apiospora phragmitis TaxID=2905665 RepID=A0ABR1VXM1_9PEZI
MNGECRSQNRRRCQDRATNVTASSSLFAVEGSDSHNRKCYELGQRTHALRCASGWDGMGLRPKEIKAHVDGGGNAHQAGAREELDAAGGKPLYEKTIRKTIVRRWRWPSSRFSICDRASISEDLHR